MGWALMIAGLLIALSASALLVMNVIESGVAIAIGVLGIGLIPISGRWLPKQKHMQPHAQPDVPTIHSADRQLRAMIKRRADGTYQVEVQKLIHDYSPDVGSHDRWERQPGTPLSWIPWPAQWSWQLSAWEQGRMISLTTHEKLRHSL